MVALERAQHVDVVLYRDRRLQTRLLEPVLAHQRAAVGLNGTFLRHAEDLSAGLRRGPQALRNDGVEHRAVRVDEVVQGQQHALLDQLAEEGGRQRRHQIGRVAGGDEQAQLGELVLP